MSLEEAIAHARETAENRSDLCDECRKEHAQLADWLQELADRKKGKNTVENYNTIEITLNNGHSAVWEADKDEQYSFYRIPKALLTDPRYKSVSIEAKVLYSLLLDRMSLSVKNNWMDIEKRIYIYFTLENVMDMMDCGHNKAVKLFAKLDNTGLIERKRQSQGRPSRIYVKSFILPPDPSQSQPEQAPPPPSPQTAEVPQSAPLEMRGLDGGFSAPNKTEKKNTKEPLMKSARAICETILRQKKAQNCRNYWFPRKGDAMVLSGKAVKNHAIFQNFATHLWRKISAKRR